MKKVVFILFLLYPFTPLKAQINPEEVLAMQYFQSGEFEKAAPIFEKLFNRTKDLNYYDPYFNSLLKTKQFNAAEKLAKSLLKDNPNNYTFSVDIGRIYLEKSEQEKASEWFNSLIQSMPSNEFAIKDLAITFYRADAYDYSIKALVAGRKLINQKDAFTYDLLSLYRFKKDKPMLIQEYINLLNTSPEALPQAQRALGSTFENKEDYELLKSAILRFLQKEPQNTVMAELLTWYYIQQKEFDMALRQTLALDRRLKENGLRIFELSKIMASNNAFDQAIESLNYLITKGSTNQFYIPAKINLVSIKNKQLNSKKASKEELIALENDYNFLLNEFGRKRETAFAIRQLANLQAYYLGKHNIATEQLETLLNLPDLEKQLIGEVKLDLGDIYILSGELWESALLFGQVEKDFANEPLGQEAKFKNAKLAYFQGDFLWSKAQLDILKSATSQLIANDALNLSLLISSDLSTKNDSAALLKYANADLLFFKKQNKEALQLLDSISVLYPGNTLDDDIAMLKTKIFINNKSIDEAIEQLQKIINQNITELWGDDALFLLAEIYEEETKQTDKAMELYQKIINDFPGSLFVLEARQRYRKLRGDQMDKEF
ncbi:tetratricopeptide repeat protein [Daejeonella sp.]|uniref:tetratricopeptide repeat protein n=1 Tax=Daejeonella sp. TaxID=2805397 RepID=UPI0025BD7C5F|nr:tetratricopeptide repeat protein [Daejeonella sp.]